MLYVCFRGLVAATVAVVAVSILSCSNGGGGGVDDDDDDEDDGQPAPAVITDLHVTDSSTVTITVAWTVPYSDATHGAARWYDLRFHTLPIDSGTWLAATHWLSVPPAQAGGGIESVTIQELLPGTPYYVALDCCTDDGHWAGLSNVARTTTLIDASVSFPDTALESVIRVAIGKPSGPIMVSELHGLQNLTAENRGIVDLTGIDRCMDLLALHVSENPIASIAPLSEMHSLRILGLRAVQLTDVEPLAGLTQLEQLTLSSNQITDLSSLAGLVNLRFLHLGQNGAITDIGIVGSMGFLTSLRFENNTVTDLAPLSGLDSLSYIDMRYNRIVDLAPLLENDELGSGDEIWLTGNPLSQQALTVDIPILESRGVIVHH